MVHSYFASAERANDKELAGKIKIVSKSPLVSGLLYSISGLLAILDEHRQLVALNDSLLKMLGVGNPADVLGLRPGEALQCIHAHEEPGGCGTSKFCSTCGAAIAIVSSYGQDKPVERICALTVKRGEKEVDLALLVRSHAIKIDEKKFLLLILNDISQQEQRAALERTFFHDVNNMLAMLVGSSELLVRDNPSPLSQNLLQTSLRLRKEVAMQRCLMQSEACSFQPLRHKVSPAQILADIESFFTNHPVARAKRIEFQDDFPDVTVYTDIALVSRVLCNMVINALEATEKNGAIKIWVEPEDRYLSFCVWNAKAIPQDVAQRIFQRNFSTKKEAGRGVGTFSMKLFGEKILGGKVGFKTSPKQGTDFRLSLPL